MCFRKMKVVKNHKKRLVNACVKMRYKWIRLNQYIKVLFIEEIVISGLILSYDIKTYVWHYLVVY
jgi:hypothetical protein